MTPLLVGIVALGFAATMVGGLIPALAPLLTRSRLSKALALRSGLVLAAAFGEILPDALAASTRLAGLSAFIAFTVCYAAEYFTIGDSCHEAMEDCSSHTLGAAALAGILAHSFVDGVNLSAASLSGASTLLAVGLAVNVCHLADGFTLTTLFGRSRYGRATSLFILAAVGLATAGGAAMTAWSSGGLPPGPTSILLGFSGGCLVYVGAADIIPRLHRDRDPAALAYFSAGAAIMASLHAL